ncbi:nucleotidyltransferase family protein [Promicromonospora iranensis]|uniref:nucleotidyltransferase family protein n=1 Tax=Promicromonospora iranensis TaxID=1105144 RepID=UPI0023A9DF9B|nr:nucleotidyltransferase family protein [Promicromonospora iranensis]
MRAVGVVLAGGAGTRFGMPKALARADDGTPWLDLACRALRDGGCADVVAVLGARADEARALVPAGAGVVVAAGWASGIAASLRAGLAAAGETEADAAVVSLVDLPGLRADAVRRVLGASGERDAFQEPEAARHLLRRAVYDGRPGHPVLVGREHWRPLAAAVQGDTGAGPYLRAHDAVAVDCTDLGGGDDVDRAGSAGPAGRM